MRMGVGVGPRRRVEGQSRSEVAYEFALKGQETGANERRSLTLLTGGPSRPVTSRRSRLPLRP
jgi:hypothetical protein